MTTTKFNAGDRVEYAADVQIGNAKVPTGRKGTITSVDRCSHDTYSVKWDDGHNPDPYKTYIGYELRLISESQLEEFVPVLGTSEKDKHVPWCQSGEVTGIICRREVDSKDLVVFSWMPSRSPNAKSVRLWVCPYCLTRLNLREDTKR